MLWTPTASRRKVHSWGTRWQLATAALGNLCWAVHSPNFLCASPNCKAGPSPTCPCTAPHQPKPCLLSLPTLTLPVNHIIPESAFVLAVTWSRTVLYPLWQLETKNSASQQTSYGSKPVFTFQSLWLLLGKKLPHVYRDQPVVIQGLDRSQRNPEALAWMDCATTLGKGVCVRELYPLIPPALPKYYTPPYNSLTEKPLAIGF